MALFSFLSPSTHDAMLANPSSRHFSRLERMASPARSSMTDGGPGLPRSTSVKATPTSPLLDANDASHQPARASISTPAAHSRQKLPSINCTATAAATPTDTPAATPKEKHHKTASYYASMWSPRRLMERASRAFRSAGRSRRKKNRDAVVGDTDSPRSVASMGSDAASALSFEEQIVVDDVHGGGAKQDDPHLEVVPEKIIHEANLPVVDHQPAAVAAEEEEERISTSDKETAAAVDDECTRTPEKETAAAEEVDEEELKKAAVPAPVVIADVVAAVTDCKLELVKEAAIKKREEEIMTEVVRRFQGSRVKTSMEKRSGDEQLSQPRRRASNEVIEEARTKLLEMRQGSRVKALVGAFETVMDANSPRAAAAATPTAGKPHLHHVRTSTV